MGPPHLINSCFAVRQFMWNCFQFFFVFFRGEGGGGRKRRHCMVGLTIFSFVAGKRRPRHLSAEADIGD